MYGSLSSARLASPEDCCTRAAGGYHVDWRSRKYESMAAVAGAAAGGSAAIEVSPERSAARLGSPFRTEMRCLIVAQNLQGRRTRSTDREGTFGEVQRTAETSTLAPSKTLGMSSQWESWVLLGRQTSATRPHMGSSQSQDTQDTKPPPQLGKSGKKICCSCPETKKPRDECIVTKGEEHCGELIEAHKRCLRLEGFKV